MGDTIFVSFRSAATVAEAVDPLGDAQRCPQLHSRRFWVAQAVAAMGDNAENDRAEADRPAGGGFGQQTRSRAAGPALLAHFHEIHERLFSLYRKASALGRRTMVKRRRACYHRRARLEA
jgi:hypothetical protein